MPTKTSALTAATAALSTHEYAVNEGGLDRKVTGAQIKTLVNTAPVFAAGSAAANSQPKLTSGVLLTTPEVGALEYDGVQLYATVDASSGRGVIPAEQTFFLTAVGSNITTIANFFGANSNPVLVANAFYEIDIWMFFLKNTAGTVTWTLTNSAAPTSQNIYFGMSPVTGIVAPPGTATELDGQIYNDTTAAKAFTTASLTTAVNHFAYFKIFLRNGTGTSLKIQATVGTGSITPGIGSRWIAKRRPAANVGLFAA